MKKNSKGIPSLKNKTDKEFIFMLDEAIPVSQQERKKYVADITFFYATVFKDKLKHFIGLQLEELAQLGRSELGNNIIRSNINCFRLIDEWMVKIQNEHFGNIQEIRNSFTEDKGFINEIKKTYGKN